MKTLISELITLEPLTQNHASGMYELLKNPQLYEFLDYGPPPNEAHVTDVYRRLEARQSPDGLEQWLNWILMTKTNEPLGFVQATVFDDNRAWIAYLLGTEHWGHGFARESTKVMIEHLAEEYGVSEFLASVEEKNIRSLDLLKALSFKEASSEQASEHDLSNTEVLMIRSKMYPT